AEPQLRNACLSFWSVKAELGLRVPGREGPVFFKIRYHFLCLTPRFKLTVSLGNRAGIFSRDSKSAYSGMIQF
ncbi:MAG: hypothetical protein EBR81_12470, partial [Proteobacteria bacterium]|nr:hypothetical protein [Pseudomonadota bacterium]